MANSIRNYFENAQLSMAAYATLQRGMTGSVYEDALINQGMSPSQATRFAADYAIVDQYTDSATGLSATVFRNNQTGALCLALRGTEGFFDVDLLADAQLLLGGAARAQIVSLYNYVQRLITPAGQSAIQVEDVAPDIDPITGYVNDPGGIRTTTSAAGLGYLAGVSGITVTGHSLGGHLAAAASRLFPTLISATNTYNAPGFSLIYAEALLDQFPGSAGAFPSTITNLVAHAGADIIAAVGTLPGAPARIFIEDQGAGIPGNHGIIPLTDALALYNLFAQLDPSLNSTPSTGIPTITAILKAASSNVYGRDGYDTSLEKTLDALRTLFQENYRLGSSYYNAPATQVDGRDDLYIKLFSLQDYLKNSSLNLNVGTSTPPLYNLTVDPLINKSAADLLTAAKATNLATRYALYKLNPFTVSGTGLYEAINSDQSLDLYDSNTRAGALTEEYLKDRSAFLYNKLLAATGDSVYSDVMPVPYVSGHTLQVFEDKTSNYQLYTGDWYTVGITPLTQFNQIRFGASQTDTLTGGTLWDKLYGMDGDDTLQGGKGNDYLEGGRGRAWQPELLRLVRRPTAAYRHRPNRHENENQIKEAE